ncbi:MAG TPA: polysaccharide biosynthesis tyrosine autokinase [Clostridia bacterium]|nr:polysaccharide biosynthesis tyrosine autokinase [Clostridia bacterium]
MHNEQSAFQREFDLREILRIISIRWWVILLFLIVSTAVTGFITFEVLEPVYVAETSLFVGKEDDNIASLDLSQLNLNKSLVTDYRQIILSRLVSREVIEEIGLDMPIGTFQQKVTVTPMQDSRLFKISFESTDPKLAMDVANALARVIIEKAQDIIEVKNIKVIDVAEMPAAPIKPNKVQNLTIAAILGILIGSGAVFLIEYTDYTVKDSKDVEKYLELITIGEIPMFAGEKRKGKRNKSVKKKKGRTGKENSSGNILSPNLITVIDPKAPASEAYRSLRTNIGYSGVDRQVKLIMVTSPGPAEGKSTTAANIAISMAQAGKKVLLMDGDLRKPRVHKYFSLANDVGLTDIIVNDFPLKFVIKTVNGIQNLEVILSGTLPPNPTEILESKKMADFITRVREEYEMIILDTPPVGQLTDGAIMASISDGVILVVASGESNIDMARRARAALERVNAKIIGTVLTKITGSSGGSYYHYYNYDKY